MVRRPLQRRVWIATALFVAACGAGTALDMYLSRHDSGQASSPPWLAPGAARRSASVCAQWAAPDDAGGLTRFAVIGDYGADTPFERSVADLVKQFRPAFILTLGDNNYPRGEAETIDTNIGLHYHEYIGAYPGQFGCGADRNRFFPTLGNHDWVTAGARPYLDYFSLPGNERYYDVVWGDVHVFALDSDSNEPDGTAADSIQARWLQSRLAASTARWQIVYMHHPPYSSGPHGSSLQMRWPFRQWGVDLVLSGHDHTYERLQEDGLPYLVNGLGGAPFYLLGPPVDGSVVRYAASAGALLIEANASMLHARFQTVEGTPIDELTLPLP